MYIAIEYRVSCLLSIQASTFTITCFWLPEREPRGPFSSSFTQSRRGEGNRLNSRSRPAYELSRLEVQSARELSVNMATPSADRGARTAWFHRSLGRMETEQLLMEYRDDGAFLVRESDSVKGAYVLSTIYQNRIHHYRIIPDGDGKLSIQAQQGVQKKLFVSLEELVTYYSYSKRGLVCGLATPIGPKNEEDEEPDSEDEPDEVSREQNIVSKFLLASLSTVDTSKVDEGFLERLRSYLTSDVTQDVESMVSPAPQLRYLKHLFTSDCEQLHRQLDLLISQVDLLQFLFERAGGAKDTVKTGSLKRKRRSRHGDVDYDSLGIKLDECAESVRNLETTAFQMLRELSVSLTGTRTNAASLLSQSSGPLLPNGDSASLDEEEVSFDVKIETSGFTGKKSGTINISLKAGVLTFSRTGDAQRLTVEHHKLLQLVKSRSREQRLGILVEGQSRKDYVFNSMQAREHFCQLVQLLRNRMRAEEDKDSISIFVATWNMGDAAAPADISSLFRSLGIGKTLPPALAEAHDLYVLGMQECSMNEKEVTIKVKATLKSLYDIEYEKVTFQALWGIKMLILVKPEHTKKVTHLQSAQVRTGIGNTLGNKGGVAASFYFGSQSLCFINCHLTSGIEKNARRNQNYHDILKGMSSLKHKRLGQFDLTNQFHHLFFFGDLNYRVDLSAPDIVEHAKKQDHYAIYLEDQLHKDKDRKKILVGFEEAPILFPPTYRFAKGRRSLDDYNWVKHKRSGIRINVPSYCDRVLWRSYPGTVLVNTSYGCTADLTSSDHSPVFATFQVGGVKQYVSEAAHTALGSSAMPSRSSNTFIILESLKAKIQTSSKTSFYVEFHSACFQGVQRSPSNTEWIDCFEDCVRPVWCGIDHVAKIAPIITEQEYLEQQHLLIMLKSQEGDEPYAECCVSLRGVIGPSPINVVCELIHQGQSVGELDTYMHVTLDHYKKPEDDQSNIYSDVDFITADKDESSLEFRPRSRTNHSESQPDPVKWRRGSMENRPMIPVPRSGTHAMGDQRPPLHLRDREKRNSGESALSVSSQGTSHASSEHMPPPVPKRRENAYASRPPASLPLFHGTKTFPPSSQAVVLDPSSYHSPPSIPAHRSESTRTRWSNPSEVREQSDRAECAPSIAPRTRNISGPPVPTKRKTIPVRSLPSSVPSEHAFPSRLAVPTTPPELHPRTSATSPLPPLPPKSPELSRPVRSHSVSTVEKLLDLHGLKQFSDVLVANGYDDINFISEVSSEELEEIGVHSEADRVKILQVFSSYNRLE